ncbi:C2H2-type zinc finger [Candidatus Nitrososphaera evergladensis SR1]|jgi:transposase|uniref:C2H2-type zinc finger n=1 Tax=Candidatus Nitrososphaera evergladensis SR1 TaxID=1459636 RepID=A0A075MLE1_9ARCH|nr:C2H2-type zinc finger protein [Candidatus Nitrososphaera evergladensis]AIF82236.1 C2H2-type zinc finger [Candidatus Nitrososphaera evergladensis SR1]
MNGNMEKEGKQVPLAKKEEVKAQVPAERPRFECEECNKTFPSSLDLEEHRKQDHVAKNTSSTTVA